MSGSKPPQWDVAVHLTRKEIGTLYDALSARLATYYGAELKVARRAHEKLRIAMVNGAMAWDFKKISKRNKEIGR